MAIHLSARAGRFLLAIAVASTLSAIVLLAAWLRGDRGPVDLESLSREQRKALAAELLTASPGNFVPTLYEPRIGYTLVPGKSIDSWGDQFVANELGFRAGPARKRPGTLRVLFVGDSWTFGVGVKAAEAFPAIVADLARDAGGGPRRLEAWSLALPGYNTMQQLAALWFFFDRLRPDAVVLCPTINDVDSAANVLPNGSLTREGVELDHYGAEQSVVYRPRYVDSYRYLERWRIAFAEVRSTERRLQALAVPLLVFFTATWNEEFAHALILESGIEAPYLITPKRFTEGEWRNPEPWRHGTVAANRLYGEMLYPALAELLGWPAAAAASERIPVYRGAQLRPAEVRASMRTLVAAETAKRIPEDYRPGHDREEQCAGDTDCASGVMGRAGYFLVRRRAGSTSLRLRVRSIEDSPSLYPLELRATIPAAGGPSQARLVVRDAAQPQELSIDFPESIAAHSAIDLILEASRTGVARTSLSARALTVISIEQLP